MPFWATLTASLPAAAYGLFLWTRLDWAVRYLIETLTGIIVLSGGEKRFTEAGRLARLFPKLKVLVSEQTDIKGALAKLGGGTDPSRIILETKSKNTYENAIFSAALVTPKPQDRGLLITGALHMPRAVASFQNAGFRVEPRRCMTPYLRLQWSLPPCTSGSGWLPTGCLAARRNSCRCNQPN